MPKPQEVMVSAVSQQELRLKGLDTSWHSCDFPDACPVCSWTCQQKEGCVRTPRFLSWPDSCQCVTDIKVAHRTLSLCLMPSKGSSLFSNRTALRKPPQSLAREHKSIPQTLWHFASAACSGGLMQHSRCFPLVCSAREGKMQEWGGYSRSHPGGITGL